MLNIVALDGYALSPNEDVSWEPVSRLGHLVVHPRTPAEEVIERSASADIILTNKVLLSTEILHQLPKLKLICVTATGYNNVDVAAASGRGVTVCNVPAYGTDAVAQFVFALLLE